MAKVEERLAPRTISIKFPASGRPEIKFGDGLTYRDMGLLIRVMHRDFRIHLNTLKPKVVKIPEVITK